MDRVRNEELGVQQGYPEWIELGMKSVAFSKDIPNG
jgi:hypothetical protein